MGPPEGNQNSRRHGAYSIRLRPEEEGIHDGIRRALLKDLEASGQKASALDKLLLINLAYYLTRIQLAIEQGAPPKAIEQWDALAQRNIRSLKLSRADKMGNLPDANTYADWQEMVLARARARGLISGADRPALPDPDVIDAEAVEVRPPDSSSGASGT